MVNLVLFVLAAAAGAAARVALELALPFDAASDAFPLATLVINLLGSFVIGLMAALLRSLPKLARYRDVLFTGFLGTFTTFSAVLVESFQLAEQTPVMALLYPLGSLLFGCGAALAGIVLGSKIWQVHSVSQDPPVPQDQLSQPDEDKRRQ